MTKANGHSPHGECGLKSKGSCEAALSAWSLPAWGVRVEIHYAHNTCGVHSVTPRMGSAG